MLRQSPIDDWQLDSGRHTEVIIVDISEQLTSKIGATHTPLFCHTQSDFWMVRLLYTFVVDAANRAMPLPLHILQRSAWKQYRLGEQHRQIFLHGVFVRMACC